MSVVRFFAALGVAGFMVVAACSHAGAQGPKVTGKYHFSPETVERYARDVAFEEKSSVPLEAIALLDYMYAADPRPRITGDGPIIVGKITLKEDFLLKDTGEPLKRGRYYHWIGKVSDRWSSGFADVDGKISVGSGREIEFTLGRATPHPHIYVFTNAPEEALALAATASNNRTAATPAPPDSPVDITIWVKIPMPRGPYLCAPAASLQNRKRAD